MKKIIIYLIAMVYITMMSCKHNSRNTVHNHDHEIHTEDHDHAENDHNHEHNHAYAETEHEHSHDENVEHDHEHEHAYKTGKVVLQLFNFIIKSSGEIKPANSSEIVLTASNAGIVHFVNNQITEGALVNQGQAIFYISGESLVENNINIKYNQVKSIIFYTDIKQFNSQFQNMYNRNYSKNESYWLKLKEIGEFIKLIKQ